MPARKQPKQQKRRKYEPAKDMPASVRVPEFDSAYGKAASIGGEPGWLDVNFCVNTFCGNFGLSWQKAEGRGRPYRLKRSYNTLRMICTECGVDRTVYSNQAVDTMFLHVLKNTLLHEHCKNPQCENYRVNFYEHYLSRYQNPVLNLRKSEYWIKCKGRVKKAKGRSVRCLNKLTVGTPWRLHGDKGRTGKNAKDPAYKYLSDHQFFMMLVCNSMGPSNVIEVLDCREENYYSLLRNLAAACNAQSGRHLIKLQKKTFEGKTLRLYSDIAQITVFVGGKTDRTVNLRYLVTVTDFNNSFFALAFTPFFMPPDPDDPEDGEWDEESGLLECHQAHAHLHWAGVPIRIKEGKVTFAMSGLGGYFTRGSYGALGHFLALRKMLSRAQRITHYVDNEAELRLAAVVAFSDQVREGRCDVVAVKTDNDKSLEKTREKLEFKYSLLRDRYAKGQRRRRLAEKTAKDRETVRKKALQESLREVAGRISVSAKAHEKPRPTLRADLKFPNARAWAYRKALSKKRPLNDQARQEACESGEDLDLWIRDPLPSVHEPGRCFLWLTRPTRRVSIKQELELYLYGKHQPVDTYLSSLRQVTSSARRPAQAASLGSRTSYVSSPRRPLPAIHELTLQQFYWNFMRRRRTSAPPERRYIPRAHVLGVPQVGDQALTVEEAHSSRKQVFEWAQEITAFLGSGGTPSSPAGLELDKASVDAG